MKTPLMFSLKRSLFSRLFVGVMVVTIVIPQTIAFSIPVAFAQEAEAVSQSQPTESSSDSDESSADRAPEEATPAISVDNESSSEEADNTKSNLVKKSDSSDVAKDVEVSGDVSTDTATDTGSNAIPADTTDTTVPADNGSDVTPTDNNGGGSSDANNTPQAADSAALGVSPVGSITVCHVIVDENGNAVTSPSGLPEASFSLNLRSRIGNSIPVQMSQPIQEISFYSHHFTQNNPSSFPESAQCLRFDNLAMGGYVYTPVFVTAPASIDRWDATKYNDQFDTDFTSVTDAYAYGFEMFDNDSNNDASRNENADGIVTLRNNRPDRVVVIVNRLLPQEPATSGTIKVCKILTNEQGNIILMGDENVPAATFNVEVSTNFDSNVTSIGTATFDAQHFMANWPSSASPVNHPFAFLDAQCVSFENLEFGNYNYSQESITGSGASYYVEPKYTDLATKQPSAVRNFSTFSASNPDSDGEISISPLSPIARVFVLNKFNEYEPPVALCADGEVVSPAEFIRFTDLGHITWSLGPRSTVAVNPADQIIIASSSRVATLQVTNNTGCRIPVSLGAYRVFGETEPQTGYHVTEVVEVGPSAEITVNLPECMAQIDAFYGQGHQTPLPYGPNGENPYVYPNVPFIFQYAFYFPNDLTWSGLPASYCTRPASNTAPVITVLGDNPMTIEVGTTFTDPGATSFDAEEGDLTGEIQTTGSVDANTIGTYTITYTSTDTWGLSDTESRTVNVVRRGGGGGDDNDNGGGGRSGGRKRSTGGEVLGAQIDPSTCSYLRDYLRRDWTNDTSEVLKLQYFLKYFDGQTNLEATGAFDQATFDAVSSFQNKYFNDILNPWGHTAPTGFVYILTKKKVNEIFCQTSIPVTSDQQSEIDNFRAFLEDLRASGVDTSSFDNGVMNDSMIKDINDMVGVGTSTSPIGSNIAKNIKDRINTKDIKAVAAAIFSVPHDREAILQSIYFLLIAIIAIYLFTEIIVGSRDSSRLTKYQVWSRKATGYFVGLIVAIIAAVWYQVFTIVVPLLVLAIASGVFLAWTMTKKSGSEAINLPPSNR